MKKDQSLFSNQFKKKTIDQNENIVLNQSYSAPFSMYIFNLNSL